ncbi:RND transporter [Rhodococcus sp. 05-2255-3B1]|uniref:MMPL family transporter n=1 Tax=unclassified Rhodococcus (in: high G+C Gram-positive bacteria) TaxID=192944 RepID=UPI000B9BFC18|nr:MULTISPECIES: MMPL family transporter [unclassified Rhodococcus (in: high G+C Gram-positive bacteria)]OZE02653.1 RND transporter [Rhodococcus sp. 05-2255-3C]OZE11281.1 RND transporter [Rhodococcus sp. 05-2255-3B1]OZE13007.1 RND transporter [Rhodococcus sp. 05-2255-2A2]
MFARWGDIVYRLRYTVIGVMVAGLLGFAAYGLDLNSHLSQSGWDDPTSESAQAARLADTTFGRDKQGDVIVLYTAPEGSTIDDPEFQSKIVANLDSLAADHPNEIEKVNGSYFRTATAPNLAALGTTDKQHAIASIAIAGANDTELTNNFQAVKDVFYIDGVNVQVTGLQAVAGALQSTMAGDIHRMELLAIPAVAVLLFFIFGGVVAAALPLIIGGLTVVGANGIVKVFTNFTEVNSFVAPVVSLVGLGLAIDYGLFIVSRFREELGDGYSTPQAVRRTVMTAGRTVVFSATMIVASLGGLLLFPQGFLKSVAYGSIATVALAALTAITILPAMLAILGPRVDALGLKFMRKTKSSEEIENGMWGRLTRWVMRNPVKVTVPIVLGLVLLTLPVGNIKFGGINETYLPPDNVTREAQGEFDSLFPGQRTEPIKLVISNAQGANLAAITNQANNAPGLVEQFSPVGASKDGIIVFKAGLVDRNDSKPAIDFLRSIDVPDGASVLVGGTPAIEQDSISALIDKLPLMAVLVVFIVTLLMFLTFGSLVLPIKAVLMTVLGLGATMGILTWIFIDGNGAGLMNFTPGPIMAPVLVLIISIVFGLSTDYEVFLLSRMVEAREKGASTSEAIRIGTSHTGRIITAAALILIVVTGAFAFSDLVMMKYIAYGMIAALIIDATLIRMFLVPATMKLLGDDCWWAPQWMKRIQQKLGLGETILEDELLPMADVPELALAGGAPSSTVAPPMRPAPRRSEPLTEPIPVVAPHGGGPIRATHAAKEESRRSVTGRPATPPEPTRAAPATPAAPAARPTPTPPRTQAAPQERPAPRPAPSRPVAPRPTVEPEPTQAAEVVRPAPPVNPVAAPPSAEPPRAPSAPRPPVAPLSRTRAARAPRAEEPDSRSIESWLADLRAPSASPPPSTPRNGSTANGSDHNGSNHSASNHGGRDETGSPQNGSDRNGHSNGSERNGTDRNGTNGSDRNGTEQTGTERNGSNGSASSEPRSEKPSGRRSAPTTEGGDSGRHRGGENGQVLSVSELLARERNRSR